MTKIDETSREQRKLQEQITTLGQAVDVLREVQSKQLAVFDHGLVATVERYKRLLAKQLED